MSQRYSRQILFKPIGEDGQQRLMESSVLIVGAGALGTSTAEMLVRAGVGHITIVDRDYVEWSNLQRQQLYTERDAAQGTPKATAALKALSCINSEVKLKSHVGDFVDFISHQSIENYNLMIDATDNFETRFILNDLSHRYNIPWIYGGAVGSTGTTYTVIPGETPCLSCLVKSIPVMNQTCDTVGVIPPTIQWVTSNQVTEALKWLTGHRQKMRTSLLYADLWDCQFTSINVNKAKKTNCPTCGDNPTFPYLEKSSYSHIHILCGRDTVQIRPKEGQTFNKDEVLKRLLEVSNKVKSNDLLIHAHLDENRRIVVFEDGRVLLHGMSTIAEAQATYDRYVRC
ncbi:thiazole biosynthesis adenylyltransferase ThiF [Bacillus carboniphilus]|uniref:Thiazole biosynthesis adenylyltransferase ThiF n=1 Tax=Bacillus carboniphilus TaxID=86663 RepID=A0ABP3FU16_9BACI